MPTLVNAIAGAEDTIDAMDLRGFGTGKRTWLRLLVYDRQDWLVLGFFVALLVAATLGASWLRRRAVDAAVPHRPRAS